MAVKKFLRTTTNDNGNGAIWHAYITTSGTSDIYEVPEEPIISVGAYVVTTSGAGMLYFSMDSVTKLGDGSAVFEAWDGVAGINPAITGVKLVATSGIMTGMVSVKTFYAS